MSGGRAAGVHWDNREQRWRARITAIADNDKSKYRSLGRFVNEVDAALAYDQAAREHHKDKAQLNFPDPPLSLKWP
jgi:hypothetical protein